MKIGEIEDLYDITPREYPVNFLKNEEVFVGALVKKFLIKLGLKPNSPEVKEYFQKVFAVGVSNLVLCIHIPLTFLPLHPL